MKNKILSMLLIGTLLLGLTGCGKKTITLNSPLEYKDWDFKLVNVEFSNKYGKSMTDCFITSKDEYESDGHNFVCSHDRAESDKTFLLFELQMEYKGNKKLSINLEKELELNYNDGYIIEPDTAYVNIGDNFDNWVYVAGTSINTKRLEVDPLEETTYILRGAFEVSEKVETETENSLKLKLPFDLEYTIR